MGLRRSVSVILIGTLLPLTGCSSTTPIRLATPAQPTWDVKPGDTVTVQTPDGERWRFKVEQIDGDTIVARGGTRFPRDEIVHLWRETISTPKTVALIAGIMVVGLAITIANAVGSILGGGG